MDALPALSFTPAVGDLPLTAQQRSLLSLAHELGRSKFAPRAAQWDATATFPFANYEDLKAAGLLGLCVPQAHGGLVERSTTLNTECPSSCAPSVSAASCSQVFPL